MYCRNFHAFLFSRRKWRTVQRFIAFSLALLWVICILKLAIVLHGTASQNLEQAGTQNPDSLPLLRCPKRKAKDDKIHMLGSYPQKKRFFTLGITSVTRPTTHYLPDTLNSLIKNMSAKDRLDSYLVILLADLDPQLRIWHMQHTFTNYRYSKYIEEDFIHVIQVPQGFYPPLENLKTKFGDSEERTKWRSKQNVDFAMLMCYSNQISEYYLHIEDDVKASPMFLPKIRDFISSRTKPWILFDSTTMGHIGKVYHSSHLLSAASFFYLFYDEMPVDWLMQYWQQLRKDPSLDGEPTIVMPASVFEHMGFYSSLSAKNATVSHMIYYDKHTTKYTGNNPKALIKSNLIQHKFKPEDAYTKGIGYFWAKLLRENDTYLVDFPEPLPIRRIAVFTGSNIAPRDFLQHGIIQASFQINKEEMVCADFEKLGTFKQGSVDVKLSTAKLVCRFRILITRNQTYWLFLREINVWKKEN